MLEVVLLQFCLSGAVATIDTGYCHDPDVLAQCEYEDSNDCYWHAPSRGNGIGDSFVDVDGLIFKWDGEIEQ